MESIRRQRPSHLAPRWGEVLPRPRAEVGLPHGYTLTQVNRIAVFATRNCPWVHGLDLAEASEHGWSAIIEHLYTAGHEPDPLELIRIAGRAVRSQHDAYLRSHGINSRDRSRPGPRFVAYWNPGVPTDHAEAVTDRLAFWQIWAQLTESERQVVRAVSDHSTQAAAAIHLGITRNALNLRLRKARIRFLALWHEGQKPSTVWISDRPGGARRSVAQTMTTRRRQRRIRLGLHTPQPDPAKRRGRDIGATDEELATMHVEGTTLTELAHRFRMSRSSIRDRIRRAQRRNPSGGTLETR